MTGILRNDINEEYAYSGYVEAGEFIFLSFCVGNVGESLEKQVDGALDNMSDRLKNAGLTLESVVKVDVLLRDAWDIPIMEKVFKRRIILQEKLFRLSLLMKVVKQD